jgi:excisionase family DNA binding protein
MERSRQSPYLSTVQAAVALRVSVSTVKRWVDDGILPAHRTAGGHRKLLRAEVQALARASNLPRGDLAVLSVPPPGVPADGLDALAAALLDSLLQGDGAQVTALIRRAYASGLPPETLADQLVRPVMGRIGLEWEAGRMDVWQEHRCTQQCAAALYDLKDNLETRAERNRPVVVGGTPEGDPYLLATLLAQLVLLDAGWEAVQLGPNTPLASLTRALGQLHPKLVWMSVSYLVDAAEFIQAFRQFCQAAERQGVAVAVGGQALVAEAVRSAIPYTTYGDSLGHLAAFARSLHPRPKRPRRGRPPRQR